MDGVLFDSIPFAEKYFLERHPGVTSKMYRELSSGNYLEEVKKYSNFKKNYTPEDEKKSAEWYTEQKKRTPLFKGIEELLADLHAKSYILALNTSAYKEKCLPLLIHSRIEQMFDFIGTAEVAKTKVEKFNLILRKYKVGKEDIVFVTDSLGDLKEAYISHIPTIAVTWGVHDRKHFLDPQYSNLIKIVDTVEDLRDTIFGVFALEKI